MLPRRRRRWTQPHRCTCCPMCSGTCEHRMRCITNIYEYLLSRPCRSCWHDLAGLIFLRPALVIVIGNIVISNGHGPPPPSRIVLRRKQQTPVPCRDEGHSRYHPGCPEKPGHLCRTPCLPVQGPPLVTAGFRGDLVGISPVQREILFSQPLPGVFRAEVSAPDSHHPPALLADLGVTLPVIVLVKRFRSVYTG